MTTLASGNTATLSGDRASLNVYGSLTKLRTFAVAQGTTPSGIDLDVPVTLLDSVGGSNGIAKAGAGTMRLSANNTFSAGISLDSGTIAIGSDGALGTGPLTFNGGAIQADTTTRTVSNAVNLASNGTVAGSAGLTLSGPISGSGGLIKDGSSTLTLSGINTFSGSVTVNAGTLIMNTSLISDVVNQATFVYNAGTFSGRFTNAGIATFNADFTAGNGMENDGATSMTAGVNMTLNGAGLNNQGSLAMTGGTLTVSSSGTNVNGGSLSLSGPARLNLTGATLTNSGMISFSGGLVSGAGGNLVNAVGGEIVGTGTISCGFSNSGGVLSVGSGAFNVTQAFANGGVIQLTAATSGFIGAAINNSGTIQGLGNLSNAVTNAGTIEAIGGTLFVGGALSNPAGGLIRIGTGNKVLVTAGLGTNSGIVNLTGGTFDNGAQPLNNLGQISGYGTFATGGAGLDNHGSITFSGGVTTINGPVTNENGRTMTIAYSPAIFTGLVTNNGGATFNTLNTTATFAGGFTNNGSSNFAKAGDGVVEIDVAPTLHNDSTLSVTTGTLRFIVVSGTPTIGTGVTATVSSGATLELAGSVAALASGSNRVNILNVSTTAGILVSGTHQQVGEIDGSGTTQVNAGSDLLANHIVQGALVIGGTSTNPGLVTIDASDPSGNPLLNHAASVLGDSGLQTFPGNFGEGGIGSADLSSTAGSAPAVLSLGNSAGGGNPSPVPEPSALLLVLVALSSVIGQRIVVRRRAR